LDVPQIDAVEAHRLVDNGAFLLDVREDDEWAAGRAPVAVHIVLAEVPSRAAEVPTDRQVVAVCRGGGRSQKAAEFLRQQGVDILNVTGGMRAWAEAGYPVVRDDGTPGTVI
jgi:rhodanese-related sulfurtransferase